MRINKTRRLRKMPILTGRRPTRKVVAATSDMIVPTFLNMLNTVKLYHWKTTSYATHKNTDDLYASLNSKIDTFVEVMLGKDELGGRSKLLKAQSVDLSVFSNNNDFKRQIEHYKTFLLHLSEDATFADPINTDLLAIRDEILADLNKFLYLQGAAAP